MSCAEVSDGYCWYDLGTWSPTEHDAGNFWVSSGVYSLKKSPEHPTVAAVWVDQISFVPEKKDHTD